MGARPGFVRRFFALTDIYWPDPGLNVDLDLTVRALCRALDVPYPSPLISALAECYAGRLMSPRRPPCFGRPLGSADDSELQSMLNDDTCACQSISDF